MKNPSRELHALLQGLFSGQISTCGSQDWGRVARYASEQGVSGFLFKRVKPAVQELGIPSTVLRQWKQDYLGNQASYFQHLSTGIPIFQTLTTQSIPFFVYKGISLIEQYYLDPGLRPIADLDVVCQSIDVPRVSNIIEQFGFVKGEGFGHHFYRGVLCIDLHTDLFRLDRIPTRSYSLSQGWNDVWKRLTCCTVQGLSIGTLHPFDEFALLSWHALKHSFSHMKWLVDLALVFQTLAKSEDFMKYLTCLPEDSVRKGVWYALRLLHEWFEIPVAQSLIQSVEPANKGWLESQAFKKAKAGGIQKSFAELCFLGTMNGLRPKMKFVGEMLFCEGFDVRRIFSAGWSPIRQAWSRMD